MIHDSAFMMLYPSGFLSRPMDGLMSLSVLGGFLGRGFMIDGMNEMHGMDMPGWESACG